MCPPPHDMRVSSSSYGMHVSSSSYGMHVSSYNMHLSSSSGGEHGVDKEHGVDNRHAQATSWRSCVANVLQMCGNLVLRMWQPVRYPGGTGGNFYAPVVKGESVKRRPSLQRSPSWTGALDTDKMLADSRPAKKAWPHAGHTAGEMNQDLAHLMYNAAQRQKAWVDGKHETKAMRIQRS